MSDLYVLAFLIGLGDGLILAAIAVVARTVVRDLTAPRRFAREVERFVDEVSR